MCGIYGYFDWNGARLSEAQLCAMGESLVHRGPDGHGCYQDPNVAAALGNLRLAILDVEHGQQPFLSDDGQIVVVQNGEIFNHVELSRELARDGFPSRTKCDTEVILRIYERDGIAGIERLNGMFAIAIFDRRESAIYLVRDRVGEKPLYFLNGDGRCVFASEIKAILEVCGRPEVCVRALNEYFCFNYVPPPLTMFSGVEHVLPGHWLKISASGIEQHCWWDLSIVETEQRSEQEWIERFNLTIEDAVRIRLRSDVPFGAFLSGGVDSSTVVGLMSRFLDEPVRTFCIGFHDPAYDESPFAQEAADRFGTNHVLEKVETNLIDLWPFAIRHCDQPHGDVSFLPTYKVAELASRHVKMVLTGDGADELFAGYEKFAEFFECNGHELPIELFRRRYLENISLFNLQEREMLFERRFKNGLDRLDCDYRLAPLYERVDHMDQINQALYLDMMLLLPGNNLVKPDRMGMAVSIENRSPFLDFRMMEMAFSMSGDLKLRGSDKKYLYKKAVTPLIGEHLAYRKKQMFTVPIGEWFKSELSDMCHDLLLSERTTSRNFFAPDYIASLFSSHCNGKANNTRQIRALMACEIWFREMID